MRKHACGMIRNMKKYCVIGTPVGHSKSPALFKRFMTEKGLKYGEDAEYLINEITDKEQLHAFVSDMRSGVWSGCNVTMPWKTDMVKYMDELSETARITDAVNTVSAKDGRLFGDSTDGRGMLNAIKAETGCDIKDKKVVMLGCGGAARSIIAEAVLRGVGRIDIICRGAGTIGGPDLDRGSNLGLTLELIEKLYAQGNEGTETEGVQTEDTVKDGVEMKPAYETKIVFTESGDFEKVQKAVTDADILINSTPLGMLDGRGNENRLPISEDIIFGKDLIVADCVYNPDETLLIKKAKEAGARTVKGIRMLEEQARCGVEILLG